MASSARVFVGTSGWSYDHWRGIFYPQHLGAQDRLAFYATRFETVEIDGTFYRLPTEAAVRRWCDAVPDDFRFAVKGSRLITHYRRLANIDEALDAFLRRVSLLGEKLVVVLWQLPPTLTCDLELLGGFLARLPGGVRHAVEFRHESWLAEPTFELLGGHGVAQVHVSGDAVRTDLTPTADFVYARLHGTADYHGAYGRPALELWSLFVREQLAEGRDCYVYFNNDAEGHAPADAARLVAMLEEDGAARTGG